MEEWEKAEYLKMREDIERREQEVQRELEKKKKEQEEKFVVFPGYICM